MLDLKKIMCAVIPMLGVLGPLTTGCATTPEQHDDEHVGAADQALTAEQCNYFAVNGKVQIHGLATWVEFAITTQLRIRNNHKSCKSREPRKVAYLSRCKPKTRSCRSEDRHADDEDHIRRCVSNRCRPFRVSLSSSSVRSHGHPT